MGRLQRTKTSHTQCTGDLHSANVLRGTLCAEGEDQPANLEKLIVSFSTNIRAIISAITSRYEEIERNGNDWTEWRRTPRTFKRTEADAFFVGVLLDKQQKANRAWEGGTNLVDNHFQGSDGKFSWTTVSRTSITKMKQIMSSGWNGGAYHRFPNRHAEFLRENAKIILNQYGGDVRNIWSVSPDQVDCIYERFLEFKGISHALARMAQFILVRDHGIAGGAASKRSCESRRMSMCVASLTDLA